MIYYGCFRLHLSNRNFETGKGQLLCCGSARGGGGREFPEGIERITVNRTMICQLEEKGGAWSDDIPLHCN